MTRLDHISYLMRWPLWVISVLLFACLAWWVLPPELGGAAGLVGVIGFLPVSFEGIVTYYLLSLNYLVIGAFTIRYMFPMRKPLGQRLARHSPPSRPLILTVSLMGGALTTGLVLTFLEWMDNWSSIIFSDEFTTLDTHFFRTGPGMAVALISWAIWIAILTSRWTQGDRYTQIAHALARLSLGAMVLLMFAAYVQNLTMQRDPQAAHQMLGSYTGLMLGVSVLIWTICVAAARIYFLPAYHAAAALQHAAVDDTIIRGRMSVTFRLIYMSRKIAFAVVMLIMAVVLWLIVTDILVRVPIGSLTLRHLSIWTGHWLLPDHGIRGIMGLYPASRIMHLLMSVIGLFFFILSQSLFELPLRGYLQNLTQHGRLRWANAIGLAMPVSGLVLGAAAILLEHLGLWSQYIVLAGGVGDRQVMGLIVQPTFWISLPVLVGSFLVLAPVFRFMPLRSTRYQQRAQILFTLFVVATLELFLAGMIQSVSYGYGGQFYNRGTYTTICIGAAVTMWTFIPALRLIYAGQDYAILTQPLVAVPQTAQLARQKEQQTLIQATGVLED